MQKLSYYDVKAMLLQYKKAFSEQKMPFLLFLSISKIFVSHFKPVFGEAPPFVVSLST